MAGPSGPAVVSGSRPRGGVYLGDPIGPPFSKINSFGDVDWSAIRVRHPFSNCAARAVWPTACPSMISASQWGGGAHKLPSETPFQRPPTSLLRHTRRRLADAYTGLGARARRDGVARSPRGCAESEEIHLHAV